jgi:glycosyltransferase involved in cell wall biosynthesis
VRVVVAGLYGSSGIDTYTKHLAEALASAGNAVLVVDRSRARYRPGHRGLECALLPPPHPRIRGRLGPLEAMPYKREVARIARAWRADLVHATQLELAPASRVPLVATAWDAEPSPRQRLRGARASGLHPFREFFYGVVDGRAIRAADAVIAITRDVANGVSRQNPQVFHVPPFVPDEMVRAPLSDRSSDCVIVANDLAAPVKNVPLAIEAVRRLRRAVPAARLVLVGGGIADPSTLPSFCVTTGKLPAPEVVETLRRAGCCLITSRSEEFGYVGIEALASGTPLVCGPLAAFRELRGTPGVFPTGGSPEQLAAAAERALSTRTFSFPEQFLASSGIRRFAEVYESAVADNATRLCLAPDARRASAS